MLGEVSTVLVHDLTVSMGRVTQSGSWGAVQVRVETSTPCGRRAAAGGRVVAAVPVGRAGKTLRLMRECGEQAPEG